MSASGSSPGWELAGSSLPAAGWYPDPAGSELLRWWDGGAWTARTLWPWSPPASPPTRLVLWLTSPAGSLLAGAVAAMTALGWVVAAAAFAAVTVTAGQPIMPAASALDVAMFPVLPVLDVAAGLCLLVSQAGQRSPVPPDGTTRAMKKAARRSRKTTRSKPAAMWAMHSALRRIRSPFLFTSLPRPVGPIFAAAASFTFFAGAWLWAWSLAHGGIHFGGSPGSTVQDQQRAAMTWMVHLIAWCGVACAQLNRNRAGIRVGGS